MRPTMCLVSRGSKRKRRHGPLSVMFWAGAAEVVELAMVAVVTDDLEASSLFSDGAGVESVFDSLC
jgi:hypothetical protein